jgi:CYTH domain-containing protein
MAVEIERRFLVSDPQAAVAGLGITQRCQIRQGYLGWVGGLRIRVRIIADHDGQPTAVLTLKGRRQGICREEHAHPLELDRAEQVLGALPPTRVISKTRYRIRYRDGLVWSVDRFEGPNTGLIIAEVELAHPEQHIELPSWVGEEITFNPRYGNSELARSPIQDCRGAMRVGASLAAAR